jgi:L-asparaginase
MSADGPMNLLQAVRVAADDEAAGKGVLIVLNGTIESARDAVKTHTTSLDTFRSPEMGALGSVQDGEPVFYRSPLRRHTVHSAFSVKGVTALPRVAILYAHADDDGFLVAAAQKAGCQGIVYAGMGNGSIPERVETALAEAAAEGIAVVRSTRSAAGRVTRAEASYEANGFIASDTLNPAKARVLLQLALLKTSDTASIRTMFSIY